MNWDEVIDLVIAGDGAAAALLGTTLIPELERYAEIIAPDLSQTEREFAVDAASAKVISKIHLYDKKRASLPTWARAFVRHALADVRRTNRTVSVDPSRLPGTQDEPPMDGSIDATDDVAVALSMLVLKLTLAEQAIVVARVHEQLPFRHIAERLGISEAAARQVHSRAIKKLRAYADKEPELQRYTEGVK